MPRIMILLAINLCKFSLVLLSKAERDYFLTAAHTAQSQISDGYSCIIKSCLHMKVQLFIKRELLLPSCSCWVIALLLSDEGDCDLFSADSITLFLRSPKHWIHN